ncbi:MAG: MarR family transcriptional regulator [Nanoarchaeota archaeon]
MDYDMFFASPRWGILNIIARTPSSPIEIAEKIGTSVSYVSQQLKLLEAAGLVVKERTGSVEKGKPRTVYSVAKEIVQFSALLRGMPAKKHIYVTDHHKIILRIWALENSDLHYYVEKLYWKIEENLDEINGIFVDLSKSKPDVLVVSGNKKIRGEVEKFDEATKNVDFSLVGEKDLDKISGEIHVIHDPKFMFLGKKMKGGEKR